VKQSFAATGLVPFDPRKMLSTYCFYKSLIKYDANAISKILAALDGPAGLVMIAAREGEVDDDSIDAALWDPLFKHVADIRYMKKKTPGMPLNHKRCLWVNNRTLIRNEFDRMERKREEERAAAEAKADKKRRREENRQVKLREQEEKRRRLEHFDAETWEPKWLGLPCHYDADGGDLLVCEAKQKTQVPHCRSAAHVSFLAAIRPREAQRRSAAQPQQGVLAAVVGAAVAAAAQLGALVGLFNADGESGSDSDDESDDGEDGTGAGAVANVLAAASAFADDSFDDGGREQEHMMHGADGADSDDDDE